MRERRDLNKNTGIGQRGRRALAGLVGLGTLTGISIAGGSAAGAATEPLAVFTGNESAGGGWQAHHLHIDEPGEVTVELSWSNQADLQVFLADRKGVIAFSTDGDGRETITHRVAAGAHRVAVLSRSGSAAYRVEVHGEGGSQDQPRQVAEGSRTEGVETVYRGTESAGGGWKAHQHRHPGGPLEIRLDWDNAAADLQLFLAGGKGVIERSTGQGQPEVISTSVPAGTYRIAVNSRSGSSPYRVTVSGEETITAPPTPAPTAPPPTVAPPTTSAPRPPAVGASTGVARRWSPGNMAVRNLAQYSDAQLAELARSTDLLVVGDSRIRTRLDVLRRANPDLDILIYLNAGFAQRTQGDAYPQAWYARDAKGNKIRSRNYGNYLMNPRSTGWTQERVQHCGNEMRRWGYDGCYLDMLGSAPVWPGYATGIPIDPTTGRAFTHRSWHQATSKIARAIVQGNPRARIVANAAGSGNRYFSDELGSDLVVREVDSSAAELWLRRPTEPVGNWPTLDEWRQDIAMLVDAESRGDAIYTLTRITSRHSAAQAAQWHRFAAGSFLLGAQGESKFAFSANDATDTISARSPFPEIGDARGQMRMVGGLGVREFTRGVALVNPTGAPHTYSLGGTYVDVDGKRYSGTVRVPAHDALVLARR